MIFMQIFIPSLNIHYLIAMMCFRTVL